MGNAYTEQDTSTLEFEVIGTIASHHATGEEKLAGAVLLHALLECRSVYRREGLDKAKRISAYFDLAYPRSIVRFWCELLDMDADVVAARFRKNMMNERSADRMFNRIALYLVNDK